jgi:hypothetical protein
VGDEFLLLWLLARVEEWVVMGALTALGTFLLYWWLHRDANLKKKTARSRSNSPHSPVVVSLVRMTPRPVPVPSPPSAPAPAPEGEVGLPRLSSGPSKEHPWIYRALKVLECTCAEGDLRETIKVPILFWVSLVHNHVETSMHDSFLAAVSQLTCLNASRCRRGRS